MKAVLYGKSDAEVYNLVTGLGGRDVTFEMIVENTEAALKGKMEQMSTWPTVRMNEHHMVSRRGLEEFWKEGSAQ